MIDAEQSTKLVRRACRDPCICLRLSIHGLCVYTHIFIYIYIYMFKDTRLFQALTEDLILVTDDSILMTDGLIPMTEGWVLMTEDSIYKLSVVNFVA